MRETEPFPTVFVASTPGASMVMVTLMERVSIPCGHFQKDALM
jgi:hypothetical protein